LGAGGPRFKSGRPDQNISRVFFSLLKPPFTPFWSAGWEIQNRSGKFAQRIIRLAEGTVLEIGAGSGTNSVHYDRARVSKLYALEPNPGMIRFAERQRHRTQLDVEYLDLPGERIPLEGRSVDSIVSTFTLGTIPDAFEARKDQVCGCLDCSSLAWCGELGVTLLFKASFTNPGKMGSDTGSGAGLCVWGDAVAGTAANCEKYGAGIG
jgi:SAM-dependent methyltransferase